MKRGYPINWIQWLTLVLALFMAFAFIVLYARIQNVQRHENDALRSIICQAEHAVRVHPGIPAQQRRQALSFYQHSLVDAHLKPCGR